MVVAKPSSIAAGSEGFSTMKIVNMYRRGALVVCTLALLLLLFPGPQQAYADGGAPNLAYVVGGSNGISVIDIGQQKVTGDRKSTRLNSSHANISYAVFCLKKKKQQ